MDELRLNGDTAVGIHGEIFGHVDVTDEEYACGGCGRAATLGGAMVCVVSDLGTIVRRPSCDDALLCHEHPSNTGA